MGKIKLSEAPKYSIKKDTGEEMKVKSKEFVLDLLTDMLNKEFKTITVKKL